MQSRLNPYLNFDGNAREAMEFYESVFGGKLTLSTFKDFGASQDAADDDKIMHSQLEADDGVILMAADVPKQLEYRPGTNISMSLSGEDEAELQGYYDRLSASGTVLQPLAEAPWGDKFGMCVDRFGISWLVNISRAAASRAQ